MEQYLYAVQCSKLSTKGRTWWAWTTYVPVHAVQQGLPVVRTRSKVDISMMKHTYTKGIGYRVTTRSKGIQRSLVSMSVPV